MNEANLLEEIFDKKMISIIGKLLENPEDYFTISDIAKETGLRVATVYRKLNSLSSKGIIEVKTLGRSNKHKFYTLGSSDKSERLSQIFEIASPNLE